MDRSGSDTRPSRGGLYAAVWRWHFYTGVLVVPFLLMLAVSGFLMLLSKPLDDALHRSLLSVDAGPEALPASALLERVRAAYPGLSVRLYLPPESGTDSARFSLQPQAMAGHGGHNAPSTLVYVDPYTGRILGDRDPAAGLYSRLKQFHGALFLGDLGDALIETAAGLAVLMIVTGLYLAWPRARRAPRQAVGRGRWRRLHLSLGWAIAVPLLFFLISGLAWTNVWGGKLVQPWGSLPGTRFEAPVTPPPGHASMNEPGVHRVPWALEQTPLPRSGHAHRPLNLDQVTAIARAQGFEHYRVHFPESEGAVWTVSATTIAGDLTNPAKERILHLDRASGETLQDIRFADYPAMGKAMAASIPVHQGDLGLWNWLLNLVLVSLVTALIITGALLWWKRRPRWSAPRAEPASSRKIAAVMLLVALCFPLSAAALAAIAVVDALLMRRRT
jgi:uncharacterized iron-regulated membrane protein